MIKVKSLPGIELAVCLGLAGNAYALEIPHSGPLDQRIRYVDYKPDEVVQLKCHYGFSTDIQFSPSETVKHIAVGDLDAWKVAPVANHVFIKPKGDMATTNMTVMTSQRMYNFELSAHWAQKAQVNDMLFQVNFRYPDEIAARKEREAETQRLQARLKQSNNPVVANWNYWAKGSEEVTPSKVFDNNQFTFLTFDNNAEMPAIFVVNPDGSESLVNTHIDPEHPDAIVIHRVARQFVMRKGNSVACVFNESYNPKGMTNDTGTTIPGVDRVIKGSQ